MDFKLIIKPIALLDVEEAVDYYEKKVSGLGRRFYNQYLASVTDIQNKPFTYSYNVENVRRYKIESFPYKIFYTVTEKTILILGVTHAKRSNAFVRRRLRLL
ncbi:MAG: type II toxin-antitoxin system RelE/ParE family toxin [Chitinophagaceae bacterium]|nr:type II toxin-antitoxin system RelE/ParE family toxin [Chitinophagaceae bacterium]